MFNSLIKKRRSIRKYAARKVERDTIRQLLAAAMWSPSSRNNRPWEFVVVTDPGVLDTLSRSKEAGSQFLAAAPLGIVVCADPAKSDVWVEDTAIAALMIQLAAESMGLASCWIQIRERAHDAGGMAEPYVAQTLRLKPGLKVASIIALGYPDQQLPEHTIDEIEADKIHANVYGERYK